ncbi:helix-turn-helix transcriptional regulator [Nocardioides solisilvae]|uniref:helix-turn-helix transcriptional regulator n=1 Tax=Nocardioides solisilvae TaxID=1542435 RepID=UPI0013A5902F|nr:helix-turn-helix domain-containing protein [Nocardioides solisilvae]
MQTSEDPLGRSAPTRRSTGERRPLLGSPVRRTIVDQLAALPAPVDGAAPGLTAQELAARLGLHVTTVRFHLDQLVEAGILETEQRGGRVGRPRKVYRVRPGGLLGEPAGDAHAALTEILAESWPAPGQPAPSPREAGRRWMLRHAEPAPDPAGPHDSAAVWFGRVGRVIDLLENWGYSPDLRTSEGGEVVEMTLVDCPFLALAATRADVVCGVHQGLIEGAVESTGEQGAEVRLMPLVGPRTCVAHLRRGHAAASPPGDPATPPSPAASPTASPSASPAASPSAARADEEHP